MVEMPAPRRKKFEQKRKRKRRKKLKQLRERFLEAKTEKEKKKLIEKIGRAAPHQTPEEILGIEE